MDNRSILMNIFLQIGAGLLPGCLVTIIILLKRKAFAAGKILAAVVLTAVCGTTLFMGAKRQIVTASESTPMLSQKKMMEFANALVLEEAYDEAAEVIDQYSEVYGYDDECRLLNSRIALLQGDYETAGQLYVFLCDNTSLISNGDEEVKFAQNKIEGDTSDLVMMNYLKSIGADLSEYGYSEEIYTKTSGTLMLDSADIFKSVKSNIKDSYNLSDEIRDCADAVAGVSKTYEAVSDNTDEEIGKEVKGFKKKFNELEKSAPELLSLECVSKARIKSYVLTGDYDAITKNLRADSDYHELMIAAELYMSGLVKKTEFSGAYRNVAKADIKTIEARLSKVYAGMKTGLTVQEKNALKARVDSIGVQLRETELMNIKEQLTVFAETGAGTDKTKVCLELAKIEYYFGNDNSSASYLSEAIYSSQDNEDDSYVAGMTQIISVISNDEDNDTENIKNVKDYVDTVLDHSLTVNVEKIVSPQYNPDTAYSSGKSGTSDKKDNSDRSGNSGKRNTQSKNSDPAYGYVQTVNSGSGYAPVQTAGFSQTKPATSTKPGNDTETPETKKDFSQAAADYVSKIKSSISIGRIDTGNFDKEGEITAIVQIDASNYPNTNALKNALRIYDCGAEIKDFTLDKIEYKGSNVMLLCDVSGSMSDSIGDLRAAVKTFITNKNEGENLAVVTFAGSITGEMLFGSDDSSLMDFANNMYASGGTDMYSATLQCLNYFASKKDENNVIILMTDGQDNTSRSAEEIYSNIGSLALEKGVAIYSMGLGSGVNTAYLNTIARSGNGDLVYISDSASLTSFFDMIHGQLHNRYELKYKASDTITLSGRTLEVLIPENNLRDVKTYSLPGGSDENGLAVTQGLSISGINPRYMYKGIQDASIKLKGTGFEEKSEITVKLNGNIDYTIEAKYVDSETYSLTVPASVAVGTYDVEISIGGKNKVLKNGFSVIVEGTEKRTVFGPYVFTSTERIEDYGETVLRGNVTMNGWLHFKGDVSLRGDIEAGGSIFVTDNSGSYVEFDEATATGIAKFLASKGIALDIPRLGSFTLYNDELHRYDYDNFLVDDIRPGILKIAKLVMFDSPTVRLYPDSINLNFKTGTTMFPYQEQILSAGFDAEMLFKFTFDGSASITDKKVGLILDTSVGHKKDSDCTNPISLFGSPAKFGGELEVKINTIKNEYSIDAMVNFDFFSNGSGIGCAVEWKGSLIPNSAKLKLELAKGIKLPTTFPLELNKFAFQVSEIDTAIKERNFTKLKFTGSMDITSCKIKDYIPGLGKFLGDMALLEMPETTASLCVNPFEIELKAQLKVLSEIKIAEAEVHGGNFDYSNPLLAINGEKVKGFMASFKQGIMWDSSDGRIKLELSGKDELDIHSRFIGFQHTGTAMYDINWWLINTEKEMDASIAFGLYTTHNGKHEWILAVNGTYDNIFGNEKRISKFYYLDENGHAGSRKSALN